MGHSYLVNTYNIAAVAFYSSIVLYYSLPILLIYNTFLWYSCACWCHGSSTQVCCYEQSYTERDSACCHSLTHTATSVTPICISPLTKYLIEMCNMISDKYMCVFVCVYVCMSVFWNPTIFQSRKSCATKECMLSKFDICILKDGNI